MNRRSFITKALAGLAAVPLIGNLATARHLQPPCDDGLCLLKCCPRCDPYMLADGVVKDEPPGPQTLWDEIEQIRASNDYRTSVEEALREIRASYDARLHYDAIVRYAMLRYY